MIKGVLSNDERHEQMRQAIGKFPMLKKHGSFSDRRISIVCYGPSLKDTWKDIQRPLMTVSGAHDFLVSRGVIPDWHVDCDPRPHKVEMLTPHKGVKYLMASVCHPSMWDKLKGHNVKLWHLVNGDDFETPEWVEKHHPQGLKCLVGGGSTVGQRAMNVAAALGFRRFNVYGMDCSFDEERHAGKHGGKEQDCIHVQVEGHVFKTTPQMFQEAREMEQFIKTMDADVVMHGNGLMQTTARILQQRKAA